MPIVAQYAKGVRSDHSFEFIISLGLRILGGIGLGISVVCFLFAESIMTIFGAQFTHYAYILRIYSIINGLTYLVVMFDQFLLATGRRKQTLYGALIYFLLALALEPVTIRQWGIRGMMYAKLIAICCLIAFQITRFPGEIRLAALKGMKTPVAVGYADLATNAGNIGYEQDRYLKSFLARLEGTRAKPASVRLSDRFGVTRQWPEIRADLPPVLGRRMLEEGGDGAKTLPGYTGSIVYRLPRDRDMPVVPQMPIQTFLDPTVAEYLAPAEESEIKGADAAGAPFGEKPGEALHIIGNREHPVDIRNVIEPIGMLQQLFRKKAAKAEHRDEPLEPRTRRRNLSEKARMAGMELRFFPLGAGSASG